MGIRAKRSENVVRAADQQASNVQIARLRDAEVGTRLSRVVLARPRTNIRAEGPTVREPGGVVDGEEERQRGHRAHAGDLAEALGRGVARLSQSGDLSVEFPDDLGQRRDDVVVA